MKQTASSGMDSVFYNNGLSLPLLVAAVFVSAESHSVGYDRCVLVLIWLRPLSTHLILMQR
jgi:hypothetical protein